MPDTIKIERCVETPTTASQGKRMVVRILNIELNYLTVNFCFRSSHMCSMLATENGYIFEAPQCLFACFVKAVMLVGKNKNFSLRCFSSKSCGKKLYSTDHQQGRLFTCLQTKNWTKSRCNEVQWLGKYACCSQRTLHRRLQNSWI